MRKLELGDIGIALLWVIVLVLILLFGNYEADALDVIYPPPAQLAPVLADFSALVKQPVSAYEIGLYRITPTTFQSSALGCPKPNTSYVAKAVKGYIVVFHYRGLGVEYREDVAGHVALCSLGLAKP